MEKLTKFKECSALERRTFLLSMVLLPVTKISLMTIGFRRTYKLLSFCMPLKNEQISTSCQDLCQGHAIARMVKIAGNILPFEVKCLPISMVIWWFLRRRGIISEMRIGVKRFNGQFEAHSWVEMAGTPLNHFASVDEQFAPFSEPIIPTTKGILRC